MPRLEYTIVDVFTDVPFGGNPLAVFADARDVPPALMQPIARELNLSETTFVLPPDDPANDHKVRIFTPGRELPMAGHPTIGTAFVLAPQHPADAMPAEFTITLEEGVGPVPVTVKVVDGKPDMLWMHQPSPAFDDLPHDPRLYAELLSLLPDDVADAPLPVEMGSAGVPYLYIPVRDRAALARACFRMDVVPRLPHAAGLGEAFVFTLDVGRPDVTVRGRMFAPAAGIIEDPATGSAAGPLGAYLVRHGVVTDSPTARIVLEQGIEMGRPSRLEIEVDHARGEITGVRVGGRCVRVGQGALDIPQRLSQIPL